MCEVTVQGKSQCQIVVLVTVTYRKASLRTVLQLTEPIMTYTISSRVACLTSGDATNFFSSNSSTRGSELEPEAYSGCLS